MNKPDWKDAPEWAAWLAQDADASWWWHKFRPEMAVKRGEWVSGLVAFAGTSPVVGSWRDTQEARP